MKAADEDVRAPLILGLAWSTGTHGGIARYVEGLHRALSDVGVAPRTLVLGEPVDVPGVEIAAAHDASLPRRLWAYARAARRLAGSADVVDAHFALYATPALLWRTVRRKPLVVHFHGPWSAEAEAAGRRWQFARTVLERALYRRADELVVLSDAFRRVLVEQYGVDERKVHVIRPGVDLDRFSPGDARTARERLGLDAALWTVVSVRRLVPRMGLDVLLDAWAQLDQPGSQLLIVGEGPERASLERRAEQVGVADSVRFLGAVAEDALQDVYRAADVCVVPTVALEGFGLVVAEALACGRPVIASAEGGLPEAVGSIFEHLLVPVGDADALAARLSDVRAGLIRVPSADECRASAERFSWPAAVERTLAVYRAAQARRSGESSLPLIVYVDHCARLSGAELGLVRLLPYLDRFRKHVILAEDGPLVAALEHAGASVEVIPLPERVRGLKRERVRVGGVSPRSLVTTLGYALRLRRRLRSLRPDIVQTESLKAAIYGGLAARSAGCRLVWHIHDRIAPEYLPATAVRTLRWLAVRLPHAVIVNSRATLEALQVDGRASIIQYPITSGRRLRVRRKARDPGPVIVGMVGRISPWKGQDVFLRAFAAAFPDSEERALVVGSPLFGEDSYFEQLHGLRSELGLDARVEFTGFRDDVETLLPQLDILVHASRVPEPFGQVIVQGMAAGLPVVAAAAGGPLEIVADGVDGFLYPPGDVEALAAILRKLAADVTLREKIGAAASISAQRYSPERIAATTIEFYRALLADDGAPGA